MDPRAVMPSSALNFSALVLAMAVIFSLSGHGAPAVIQSLIQVSCIALSLPGSLGAWLPIYRAGALKRDRVGFRRAFLARLKPYHFRHPFTCFPECACRGHP
jgi:hypothetical protein